MVDLSTLFKRHLARLEFLRPSFPMAETDQSSIAPLFFGAVVPTFPAFPGAHNLQRLEPVVGTNPGAGSSYAAQVPAGEVWIIRAVTATLTTSAVAGNRYPYLALSGPSFVGTWFRSAVDTNILATATCACYWAHVGANALNNVTVAATMSIPVFALCEGMNISIIVNGMDAGDTLTNIYLVIERYKLSDMRL